MLADAIGDAKMTERAASSMTDDLIVLGPAIVGAVRDAVRDAVETSDPSARRLRPSVGALVERTRAYGFPPERALVALKRILTEQNVAADCYSPWLIATEPAAKAHQRAIEICIDEYYRPYPWENARPADVAGEMNRPL
jgi:hypothetical protein